MSDGFIQVISLLAGILIGVMFFGGLWLTVLKIVSSKRPAFWFLGSLLLRTAFTLAGFYFASNGRWDRLVLCLLGFLISRIFVMRYIRGQENPNFLGREASRAP